MYAHLSILKSFNVFKSMWCGPLIIGIDSQKAKLSLPASGLLFASFYTESIRHIAPRVKPSIYAGSKSGL